MLPTSSWCLPLKRFCFPCARKHTPVFSQHGEQLVAWLAGLWGSEDCPRGVSTWFLSSFSLYYRQFLRLCGFSAINHVASLLSSSPALIWAFTVLLFCYDSFICFLLSIFCCYCLLLIFVPVWVYALKQNKTKQTLLHCFCAHWRGSRG